MSRMLSEPHAGCAAPPPKYVKKPRLFSVVNEVLMAKGSKGKMHVTNTNACIYQINKSTLSNQWQ